MSPHGELRTNRVTVTMTDDEKRMLEEVAAHANRAAADWLRNQVIEQYSALILSKKSTKGRK